MILGLVPVLIWWERKVSAYIQDRRGPNRANILGIRMGGLVLNLADAIKLFFKEDIIPAKAERSLYILSPMIVVFVVMITAAVIPFSAPVKIGEHIINTSVASLNIGILYIVAIASLGVYGVMLAGWSSGSSYSLLGGIRASAQMISYEVAMGLALMGVLMWSGTVRLDEMIALQGANPLNWNIVYQPLAFIIFLVALFAETNRSPFDLPEGDSEIVAGYHTEYSSMKFAMFFMAEYAHIVVGSMIVVALFFGGWQVPFLSTAALKANMSAILKIAIPTISFLSIFAGALLCGRTGKSKWNDLRDYEPLVFGGAIVLFGIVIIIPLILQLIPNDQDGVFTAIMVCLAQMAAFFVKVLFFCWSFIWVRWTLPRLRYDQLMRLGWKIMVPLAALNIIITGIVILI